MKKEFLAAGFWLLFSAYTSLEALRLGLGNGNKPGPGFFPFGAAIAIGIIALSRLLRARGETPSTNMAGGSVTNETNKAPRSKAPRYLCEILRSPSTLLAYSAEAVASAAKAGRQGCGGFSSPSSSQQAARYSAKENKILWAGGGLLAYALFLESLGFLLCTFILNALFLKAVAGRSWLTTLSFALSVALAAHLIFNVALRAQLPSGILTF